MSVVGLPKNRYINLFNLKSWSKVNVWCEVKTKKLIRIDFYDSQLEFQRRIILDGTLEGMNKIFDGKMPKSFRAQFDLNSPIHSRYDHTAINLYSDSSYKQSEGYNLLWDNI